MSLRYCLHLALPVAFAVFQSSQKLRTASAVYSINEHGVAIGDARHRQREASEFTPPHSVCIKHFECSDPEGTSPPTYTVSDVTTKAKCAKECSWLDGCLSYSFNNRRPRGQMCRLSNCDGDHCGQGWEERMQLFKNIDRKWSSVPAKAKPKGCNVAKGKFSTIELCYMEPVVPSVDYEKVRIASEAQCTANYKSIAMSEHGHEDHCRDECAKRLGCRVFTFKKKTEASPADCRISVCGRPAIDTDSPDDTKGCSPDKPNMQTSIEQMLDGIDKKGSCFMSETPNVVAYKIKFKKGGRVTSVSFGGDSHCKGVEITNDMKSGFDYYHGVATHKLQHVPAYLFGGVIYGWTHVPGECDFTTPPDSGVWELKMSYTTGVKLYIIATSEMSMLESWTLEPSATGTKIFQLDIDGTPEELYIYSRHLVEGEQATVQLQPDDMAKVRAVASQCADAMIPGPVEPGITRVSGGNVSWALPARTYEGIISHPHDKNWEHTSYLQLPPYLMNGLYVGPHLENYINDKDTVVQWPGQHIENGPLWDLTLHYLPPVKICMLVWNRNNKIHGVMTKKFDAHAPPKLTGDLFWLSSLSHTFRNDSTGFHFNSYCKFFEDNPDDPGVEQDYTIPQLNGTLIAGVFSENPNPDGVPKEGEQ